jgi:hypothetical protein
MSNIIPGAPYQDPTDVPAAEEDVPVRNHTIHCLRNDIVYNDEGDHDPEGLYYVHENDVEAARNGDLNPEPLFLRANVGEEVNVTVVNETDVPLSIHPHFVAFDSLGSDSTPSIGANYEESAEAGETRQYKWFADEEGSIYFHDHATATAEGMHGIFAGLIVEPPGSEHLDQKPRWQRLPGTRPAIQRLRPAENAAGQSTTGARPQRLRPAGKPAAGRTRQPETRTQPEPRNDRDQQPQRPRVPSR